MARLSSNPGEAGLKVPAPNRQQSERSPSENKERAYVAASRRGDRSIEARVESAKAASKIHFERTGKRLKISEEIVRKEEMYEEEDDHLPMAIRNVAFRPDIPQKFRDYSMIHMGMRQFGVDSDVMSKQDNEARINSEFAAAFPGAATFPVYQQPRRQTEPMSLMTQTTFQPSDFMSNDWQSNSAMSPTTLVPAVQSPGLTPFLPETQGGLLNSSHGTVRTPSDQSVTMYRNGSTSSTRSPPMMERQGSGASTLSHGPAAQWPPSPFASEPNTSYFAGPHSATTPVPPSHELLQARSMSVTFPNEQRGNRRRRDDSTSALSSPIYGLPIVSPNHASIPPAKRNRSDAGLVYGRMDRGPPSATPYPFSRDMPGNVQGMMIQSPSANYQSTPSASHKQALAHDQFQQGLAHKQGTQSVPRLQAPPRKAKGQGQAQLSTQQPTSRVGSNRSETSLKQAHQLEPTKKPKMEADEERVTSTVAATPTQVTSPVEAKPEVEMDEPAVKDQAEQDEPYSFDGMGNILDHYSGQDNTNFFGECDFTQDGLPEWNMDGGSFNFEDLLQFPASQPDE